MARTTIKLARDTRTLNLPTLQDLVHAVSTAEPGTTFDVDYNTLGGKVSHGLELSVIPGSRTLLSKTWVISQSDLTFQDGTIQLPDHYHILITGKNVAFKNVTISGKGRSGDRHTDPYLLRVAGQGQVSLIQCILECESRHPHALLVDSGATCTVSSTRIYGGGVGCALKLCGGTVHVNKRSVLQGGTLVTSSQKDRQPAARLLAAAAAGTQPLPGEQSDVFEKALAAAAVVARHADAGVAQAEPQDAQLHVPAATPVQPAAHSIPPHPQVTQHPAAGQSFLDIRNSEVLSGPVSCLTVHGSGSRVVLDSCTVGGRTNYGVLVSKEAQIEMTACEVSGPSTVGATLSGGGKLKAKDSSFKADTIGLRTQLGATADLASCTCASGLTPSGEPLPLPPAPKPGFITDFLPTVPVPAEARGRGAAIVAKDCVFGWPGVKGWREAAGGAVAVQEGIEAALRPVRDLDTISASA